VLISIPLALPFFLEPLAQVLTPTAEEKETSRDSQHDKTNKEVVDDAKDAEAAVGRWTVGGVLVDDRWGKCFLFSA